MKRLLLLLGGLILGLWWGVDRVQAQVCVNTVECCLDDKCIDSVPGSCTGGCNPTCFLGAADQRGSCYWSNEPTPTPGGGGTGSMAT
jgi:hypothetical protein